MRDFGGIIRADGYSSTEYFTRNEPAAFMAGTLGAERGIRNRQVRAGDSLHA